MSKSKSLYDAVELNWSKLTFKIEGETGLVSPFREHPGTFLDFAEVDFRSKEEQGRLNAFSNAKIAMHAQIKKVLSHILGYTRKKKTFIQKVEILQELDVVAPDILRALIELENYLERWEYSLPERNEVKNAIAVVASFIDNSNTKLREFQSDFAIGKKETISDDGSYNHCLLFRREYAGLYKLTGLKNGETVGMVDIYTEDREYKAILKLGFAIGGRVRLSIDRRESVEEALKRLQGVMRK
jgi:hypothetical protein